jgi:hypothetical protein
LEFAVENVAEPLFNVAAGMSASALHNTRLPPANCNRAAPARNCILPNLSVSKLSPLKTVVPIDAAARPTCARSADTTVPRPVDEAPRVETVIKLKDTTTASTSRKRSRERAIESPRGLVQRILTLTFSVNV